MSDILFVFHFEMSGNEDNLSQPENIKLILLSLSVFHLDISDKNDKFEQLKNILHLNQ